jgi:cytochrome c peroxidase
VSVVSFQLRQCRFGLGDPQEHVHIAVQGESGRERRTRLLPLAGRRVQRAEAAVAVGLQRAHAQLCSQGEGLMVVGFSLRHIGESSVGIEGAKLVQGTHLVLAVLDLPGQVEDLLFEQTLGIVQAALPSTELVEMAGFTGVKDNPGSLGPAFAQFDDGKGEPLPPEDATGTRNAGILTRVTECINAIPAYLQRFGDAFNNGVPLAPGQVDIHMRREALGEFQMAITAANAPLDQFARGDDTAMSAVQKRGALLSFGKAGCVDCHAVAGEANEMFSDFKLHRIAGPQVFPDFGVGTGNVAFTNGTEDVGEEETSGDPSHRYMFRTAPLRNLAVAVAFFHNGAFGSIEHAIQHHLNPIESARTYNPKTNHLASDLHVGSIEPVLAMGLDPLLQDPPQLSKKELHELTVFVSQTLLDPRVLDFCTLVPKRVPSGLPLQRFQGCEDD